MIQQLNVCDVCGHEGSPNNRVRSTFTVRRDSPVGMDDEMKMMTMMGMLMGHRRNEEERQIDLCDECAHPLMQITDRIRELNQKKRQEAKLKRTASRPVHFENEKTKGEMLAEHATTGMDDGVILIVPPDPHA